NGGSTSSSSGLSSSSLQASMQEFKLFETQLNFYMIGWNGNGVYRVLKLDRIDTSDLNITDIISVRMPPPIPEKNATSCLNGYTKATRPHAASNWSLSVMASLVLCRLCSLKDTFFYLYRVFSQFYFFVLHIYVVSGFIKFLGPYSMLVITERREICQICGHMVYEVSKSEIISLRNSSVLSNIANSRDENVCFHLPFTILCHFFVCSKLIVEESFCFSFLFGEKRVSTCVYLLHTFDLCMNCSHNLYVSLSGVSHMLINRYKKLMCMVDLTNDFFFSYSFNIMRSFQKNLCNHESGATLYKKMFVWNEFLTRGIRHQLWNTAWTVALVYGFFKQVQLYFLLLTAKE
ncbi:hypothetical protein HID58_052059, partial [Brassica napus]